MFENSKKKNPQGFLYNEPPVTRPSNYPPISGIKRTLFAPNHIHLLFPSHPVGRQNRNKNEETIRMKTGGNMAESPAVCCRWRGGSGVGGGGHLPQGTRGDPW